MATKRVSEKKLVVSSGTANAPSTRKAAPSKRTSRSAAPVEMVTDMAPNVDAPQELIAAQAIEALAYSYWMARGCEGGSPEEDWLRAERELLAAAGVKLSKATA